MTELHQPDRLRQLARVLDQPSEPPRRLLTTLQWSVDPDTGRPVGSWVIKDDRETSS